MIHRYSVVDSTQAVARDLVVRGTGACWDVVVANTQSVGRGRRGRVWRSPTGGLYATWILPSDPLISIRAGTAVARALIELGCSVGLKWPNDVLVGDKKVAGLLVEVVDAIALVGIGVNRNCEPCSEATSLRRQGVMASVDAVIHAIDRELRVARLDHEVLAAYRRMLLTLGKRVCIEHENGTETMGVAADIDGLGRLVVDDGTSRVLVTAGRCVHLWHAVHAD